MINDLIPDVPTLSGVLSNITFLDGSKLQKQQVEKLVNLKKKNKTPMFSLEKKELLLNLVSFIDQIGFEDTFEYLKKSDKKDDFDLVKLSPVFEGVRRNNFIEMTSGVVLEKIIETIHQCWVCPSRDIRVSLEQKRGSDEGQTEIYTCQRCGNQWFG